MKTLSEVWYLWVPHKILWMPSYMVSFCKKKAVGLQTIYLLKTGLPRTVFVKLLRYLHQEISSDDQSLKNTYYWDSTVFVYFYFPFVSFFCGFIAKFRITKKSFQSVRRTRKQCFNKVLALSKSGESPK